MAVAFSKPEPQMIYHNSLPIVNNPDHITYDYVVETAEKIQVEIPSSYSTIENQAIFEIFSQLYEVYLTKFPENWTMGQKYRVLVDCSVKMMKLMGPFN